MDGANGFDGVNGREGQGWAGIFFVVAAVLFVLRCAIETATGSFFRYGTSFLWGWMGKQNGKSLKKLPQKVIIRKKVVSLHLKTKHKKMTKVKIEEVQKTDIAGLFTICFEGDDATEFQKFIEKFKEDATRKEDLSVILTAINRMLTASGFLERYFRPEGKMGDHVVALPIERTRMRLYCLRMSDSVLIVGNGGMKSTKTYEEDESLNGYVITLQRLDKLLGQAMKSGKVTIEETTITGIDKTEFEL